MRCLHIQERSAGPDDIIATDEFIKDAERDPWTNIPDLNTTSCCSLWRGERLWWWLVIPSFLLNLTAQTSKPWCVWFGLESVQGYWLNTWQFILRHRTDIASMGCSVCCWIKDLRTETSIFPSGEKKTCYGDKGMTEAPMQSFYHLCFWFWMSVSRRWRYNFISWDE